ncbi:hypothetical protein ACFUOZ_21210 [Paenarthrobacter sp. NPDC057355]|uniref:hypothetical protein n=1 Tax=Paenarthrobacter sp. NPDC057355 TaxID=3346105 RepID=UPI003639568A
MTRITVDAAGYQHLRDRGAVSVLWWKGITFRYASQKLDRNALDLRPAYTAPSETAAKERLDEFTDK